MIIDLFLLLLQGMSNIILAPLTLFNIAVDFVASIPVITSFLQVLAFILPFNNLIPLFVLVVSLFVFRIGVSLVKTFWDVLPLL